jgi:hypothetical protein
MRSDVLIVLPPKERIRLHSATEHCQDLSEFRHRVETHSETGSAGPTQLIREQRQPEHSHGQCSRQPQRVVIEACGCLYAEAGGNRMCSLFNLGS